MRRTQIQLPDPLYVEIRRIAREQDWSVTEVLRRGAEHMIRCYPPGKERKGAWQPPAPRHLGAFRMPVEDWREAANQR